MSARLVATRLVATRLVATRLVATRLVATRLVAWGLAHLVAGCASDEPPVTTFKALSKNEFTFEARADMAYPENDPDAEATRMEWLKQALDDRQMCRDGYNITGHTLVAAKEEALGQTHNIAYHGVCK